jgi:hypothetical protein
MEARSEAEEISKLCEQKYKYAAEENAQLQLRQRKLENELESILTTI